MTADVRNETAQAFLRAMLTEQRAESAERAADMTRVNEDGYRVSVTNWEPVRDAWEAARGAWDNALSLVMCDLAADTEHMEACQAGAGRARRGIRYALDILTMGA